MPSDPLRWRGTLVTLGIALALFAADPPALLATDARGGWTTYTAATEQRIARELQDGQRFLGLDFAPDAERDRAGLLAGETVVRPLEIRDRYSRALDVPSATVQHWRGAVLIPGIRLEEVMRDLQDGPPADQEDVLRAAVLSRGPDSLNVFLRLRRTRIITVVYDTEHRVTFRTFGPNRASSTSIATKIAEVADAGTPTEHELPPGEDRGLLWKLNAYWRYEQVGHGVIAECESVTLSREVPSLLRPVAMPLVRGAAHESMERTLTGLRAHFTARRTPRGSLPAR